MDSNVALICMAFALACVGALAALLAWIVACRLPVCHGPRAPGTDGPLHLLGTDAVGSTRSWLTRPASTHQALLTHFDRTRHVVRDHAGYEVKQTGDGLFFVFREAHAAASAAIKILCDTTGSARSLAFRVALHGAAPNTLYRTLDPVTRRYDYHGPPVNSLFRVLACGADLKGQRVVATAAFADAPHRHFVRPIGVWTLHCHTPAVVPLYQVMTKPDMQICDPGGSRLTESDIAEEMAEEVVIGSTMTEQSLIES